MIVDILLFGGFCLLLVTGLYIKIAFLDLGKSGHSAYHQSHILYAAAVVIELLLNAHIVSQTYLIFVTSTTSGEKICHVEKFFHTTDCEKCEENLSHRERSPYDKCGAKCGEICHVEKCFHMTYFST